MSALVRSALAAGAVLAVRGALDPAAVLLAAGRAANATLASGLDALAYPSNGNADGAPGWETTKYSSWTSGFFPGLLWKLANASAASGDGAASWWARHAAKWTAGIAPEAHDTTTHDVGFMVFTSFGAQYALQGDAVARRACLDAAASLSTRFVPAVGAIRSWGQPNAAHTMETIADNLMNLELLWWAASPAGAGNETYAIIAHSHARRMIADLFQPFNPGCAWHLITYDDRDGSILNRSSTPQWLGLDTVWSRGQAWATAGYVIAYRYTADGAYLAQAQAAADCFLRLLAACCAAAPTSGVPEWDFNVTVGGPQSSVDTSAALIAASALIELSWRVPAPADRARYLAAGAGLLTAATGTFAAPPGAQYAVLNGTVTWPLAGIPIVYGEYYAAAAAMQWAATPAEWREEALRAAARA